MADKMLRKGTINGRVIQRSDIKVGVLVHFPSGLGGSFEYVCISVDSKKALFKVHKPKRYEGIIGHWQQEVVVEFDVPDFTMAEWMQVSRIIRNGLIGDYDRQLMGKAYELGYAEYYNQWSWTQYGLSCYKVALEHECTV